MLWGEKRFGPRVMHITVYYLFICFLYIRLDKYIIQMKATIEQIYTGCLAEAAYYIESEGEAVIIDPLRETGPYLEKLEKTGAQLKYIFETHFHADFVSGHIDLAKATGATIVYGPLAETSYEIYSAKDGEEIRLGNISFVVLHTPWPHHGKHYLFAQG